MSVLVIIPAYNADRTITEIVGRIQATKIADEIAIVNDGSRDDTGRIISSLEVTALEHEQNRGYGAAQKTLYRYATESQHEYIIIIHSDGGHKPEDIKLIIEPLKLSQADMVVGSRMQGLVADAQPFLNSKLIGAFLHGEMPTHRFLGNLCLTMLQNLCYGTHFHCFHEGLRALSRSVLGKLAYESLDDGYHFDNELLVMAHKLGLRITEVLVSTKYRNDVGSKAPVLQYGFKTLSFALGYRFNIGRESRLFKAVLEKKLNAERHHEISVFDKQ